MVQKLIENQKYIYVLLSRTQTVPSMLIRKYTREPYAHTSIALDIELKEMYSFARKTVHNPFNCGFISENIEQGIFGRDKKTLCNVYALPVTQEQYQNVIKEISYFKGDVENYNYNYLGVVALMFGKAVEHKRRYFCSQFVSYILKNSGIDLFDKSNALVKPYDFRMKLKDKIIYNGKLSEYRNFLDKADLKPKEEVAKAV